MSSSFSLNLSSEKSKTRHTRSFAMSGASASPANIAPTTRSRRAAHVSTSSAVLSRSVAFMKISRKRSTRSEGGRSSDISTHSSSTCLAASTTLDSYTWNDRLRSPSAGPTCRLARAKVVTMCLGSFVPTSSVENGASEASGGAPSSEVAWSARHRRTTSRRSSAGETPQKLCTWCGSRDIAPALLAIWR